MNEAAELRDFCQVEKGEKKRMGDKIDLVFLTLKIGQKSRSNADKFTTHFTEELAGAHGSGLLYSDKYSILPPHRFIGGCTSLAALVTVTTGVTDIQSRSAECGGPHSGIWIVNGRPETRLRFGFQARLVGTWRKDRIFAVNSVMRA